MSPLHVEARQKTKKQNKHLRNSIPDKINIKIYTNQTKNAPKYSLPDTNMPQIPQKAKQKQQVNRITRCFALSPEPQVLPHCH